MSNQRTVDDMLDEVLRKVSTRIYKIYIEDYIDNYPDVVNPETIFTAIKDVPDSLRCTHVFKKEKQKDKVCNVVLCPYHKE